MSNEEKTKTKTKKKTVLTHELVPNDGELVVKLILHVRQIASKLLPVVSPC